MNRALSVNGCEKDMKTRDGYVPASTLASIALLLCAASVFINVFGYLPGVVCAHRSLRILKEQGCQDETARRRAGVALFVGYGMMLATAITALLFVAWRAGKG